MPDTSSTKKMAPSKREFILLDEGWDITKYVAVGLKNVGCTVHMVTATDGHPDAKYLGRKITCEAVPPVRSEEYIGVVGDVLDRWPAASVLALTEEILYRIWDTAPAWAGRVFPICQPWQRTLLCGKARLSEYVAATGVRVPKQRRISPADELGIAVEEFGLPVVVKGATSTGGARVRIARTRQDAVDTAARIAKDGNCFLQEYVAGPTFLVGGLFVDGQPIRLYAGEKIECAHATGPSIRLRTDDDPNILLFALVVFRALRWTGLASLDMMRRSDGNYTFIEFNPRPWGALPASARAGVDLFRPLVSLLSGETPEPDLSFVPNHRTTLFPQTATARLRKGGIRSLTSLVREPHIWLDAPWRNPGLVAHLVRQLWWRWRDGRPKTVGQTPDQGGAMREMGEHFGSARVNAPKG